MVVWVTPANFSVIVEEAAKLLPETVTVVPTTPLVGLKVMPEVTVNEAYAVLPLLSEAWTV